MIEVKIKEGDLIRIPPHYLTYTPDELVNEDGYVRVTKTRRMSEIDVSRNPDRLGGDNAYTEFYIGRLYVLIEEVMDHIPKQISNKILIVGHGRHGKDTMAEILNKNFGLTFESSSMKAAELFIFESLKDKYNYKSFDDCYNDRSSKRVEWHDLIIEYNKEDKARLAKDILLESDIYVGMRSKEEHDECISQGLFGWVIGVFDIRKPLESSDSFDIDLWNSCDFIVPNSEGLEEFESRINKIYNKIK